MTKCVNVDFNFSTTISTNVHVNSSNGTTREVEITAYAPEGFANLRSRFGVSETDFARSILGSGQFVSFQSNSKGSARTGKSGMMIDDDGHHITLQKK